MQLQWWENCIIWEIAISYFDPPFMMISSRDSETSWKKGSSQKGLFWTRQWSRQQLAQAGVRVKGQSVITNLQRDVCHTTPVTPERLQFCKDFVMTTKCTMITIPSNVACVTLASFHLKNFKHQFCTDFVMEWWSFAPFTCLELFQHSTNLEASSPFRASVKDQDIDEIVKCFNLNYVILIPHTCLTLGSLSELSICRTSRNDKFLLAATSSSDRL